MRPRTSRNGFIILIFLRAATAMVRHLLLAMAPRPGAPRPGAWGHHPTLRWRDAASDAATARSRECREGAELRTEKIIKYLRIEAAAATETPLKKLRTAAGSFSIISDLTVYKSSRILYFVQVTLIITIILC